jgi:formylmethanofuran dehydrogenase subunit E
MVRKRSSREIEELRGENKQLRKLVKHLRKELHRAQNQKPVSEEEPKIIKKRGRKPKCPECGENMNDPVDLGVRLITTCSSCDYRKVEHGSSVSE